VKGLWGSGSFTMWVSGASKAEEMVKVLVDKNYFLPQHNIWKTKLKNMFLI
jgi:hypothetical protein